MVARTLYFAPERLEYTTKNYTGIGLGGIIGGLTLMASILLFTNCTWMMQVALFVTYAVLNTVY
jgi:hypothetical protein